MHLPVEGVESIFLDGDGYPYARNELQDAYDSHFYLTNIVRAGGDERAQATTYKVSAEWLFGRIFEQSG